MYDPIKEHLHGSMTDLIGRLHDRGDARLKEIFRNQFVKCNEGDAVRSREAQRVQALQRAQTRNSVGGEQGCRLVLLTQQPTLADGMDVLHLKARGPDERRVHGQSGVFQCATVAAQALLLISQRQRARNDCDAAMPERGQMLDSELRRAPAVHARGICIQAFRETVQADNRQTRGLVAPGCDQQDAVHTLPEQGHHVYLGIVTSLRVRHDQEISAFPGGIFGSAHDLGEESQCRECGYDWFAGFGR